MKIITLDTYIGWSTLYRQIAFLSVFFPGEREAEGYFRMLQKHSFVSKAKEVSAILPLLVNEGVLVKPSQRNYLQRYKPAARYEHAVVKAMLTDAQSLGWWPLVSEVKETSSEAYDSVMGRFTAKAATHSTRPMVAAENQLLLAEGLRHVYSGTACNATPEFRRALLGSNGRKFVRALAWTAERRFDFDPPFGLNLLPNDPLWSVIPAWLNLAFVRQRDVRPILKALRKAYEDTSFPFASEHYASSTPCRQLLRSYLALCVWTGDRAGLDIPAASRTGDFGEACRQLSKGNLVTADNLFKYDRADLEEDLSENDPDGDDAISHDEDNLPERLLAAMTAVAVKPEKLVRLRPVRLLEGLFNRRWTSELPGIGNEYANAVDDFSQWAAQTWIGVVAGRGRAVDLPRLRASYFSISALFAAWVYRTLTGNRTAARTEAQEIWKAGKGALAAGYPTLAGLYASTLAGAYDADAERETLRAIDAEGVRLLPRVEPEPEWKSVLAQLQKVAARAAASEERRGQAEPAERILWMLQLEKAGNGTYSLDSIGCVKRRVGAPTDGSQDSLIDTYDLTRARALKNMSEKDRLPAHALYDDIRGYGFGGGNAASRRLELYRMLCGMPNLLLTDGQVYDANYNRRFKNPRPVALSWEKCSMSSSVSEDGGLVFKVPEWTLGTKDKVTLRKIDNAHYAFVEITTAARKVIDLFGQCGAHGAITIPRAGAAEAMAVVEKLADVLPTAEPTVADTENLPHVTAESVCRLRLRFSEGIFTAQAVVQPMPENAALTLTPGAGAAEKLVAGAAGGFILVRDLEREKAHLAEIVAALAESEEWYDGRGSWQTDDIAAALALLQKIRTLEPGVTAEWLDEKRMRVSSAPASGVTLSSKRTAEDWFRVDGEFKLDDGRVMSVVQMIEAAKSRVGNYVKLSDGDYVALTKSMMRELDALGVAGRRKGDGLEIVKAAIPMLDNVFGDGVEAPALPDAMRVTAEEIRAAFAKRPTVPKAVTAELRPYQEDGYRWLSRLAACGFGACLADDMGLGKTLQVIALLVQRAADGASLVVAPASVCGNWRNELHRFAPTLRPVMAMALEDLSTLGAAKPGDVVIASYGFILFHEKDFAAPTWNGLVLDEAQAIKNDASKRARMVKTFQAKFRVAATGTPVENRLGDLWSIFDFLNPGLLGPAASFASRFTVEGKALPELKRLVKPLVLRRLKGDVLDDLPEKTEITIPVELGKEERTAYEGCRQYALAQLANKAEEEGGANRMSILAELTRLRRFCCHPSLVLPGAGVPSAKMEALVDLLEGLHGGRHRALVFSQFTDYLALVRKTLEAHGWTYQYLDGATPTLEREKRVNAFQSGEGDFFLISLKAGGTGLNLTAANYVILLDPWWNPAVENQAADRVHRIGQKNPVTVYRLIASDTVEARVLELHREKKEIAEDVLDGTSSSALTPAQLMRLFS